MNFFDLMNRINFWLRERETDLQNLISLSRKVVYCVVYSRKNLSLCLQHLLRSLVFIYTDFQLNDLHPTLCFLEEFSFSLYRVNYFVFS